MATVTASMPSSSLNKIQRWMAAKRAAGVVVQPWELEAAYKAELDSAASNQRQGRSLSLQAEALAESKRMNDVNTGIKREEIDASGKATTMDALSRAATIYLLKNNKTGEGLWDKASNLASKGYNAVANAVGGGTNAGITGAAKQIVGGNAPAINWDASGSDYAAGDFSSGSSGPTGYDVAGGGSSGLTGYLKSTGGGLLAEKAFEATGLGNTISNAAPMGGSKDWNRAAGATTAALLSGGNPLTAAGAYLATSIGLDKIFHW
jgi:hypothetical protein